MPVAWTFKGESGKSFTNTAVTLASQGVSSAIIEFKSLEADILTLEYNVLDYASSATLPELRQKISLYRDGTRFFHGHVIRVSPRQSAQSSTVKVQVAGPWWWLERIPMTTSQTDGEGTSKERPMFVFGSFSSGADMATNIGNAIDRAIALGAPMIKGSIASSFTVPRITLSQETCGGVLAELVRLVPDTMVYFDYADTGTDANATIKVERRASATARDINLASSEVVSLAIDPLIELEVSEVKIPFVTRAATGETQFVSQDSGSGATGKVEILPVSGPELVDFLPNDQLDTLKIANVYDRTDAGLLSAVKQTIWTGWADVVASVSGSEGVNYSLDVGDNYIYSPSGTVTVNRNLSSATGGAATEDYPAGTTAIAQTNYPTGKKFLCFEDNQEPPQWAIDEYTLTEFFPHHIAWWDQNLGGGSPTYNEERRFAIMDATEWSISRASSSNAGIDGSGAGTYMIGIWLCNKEARIWMCDAASIPADNVLIRGADFSFAAPPANFAANLLGCQNYVPHEGTITLTSTDVGATRYRGTKVNVAGSLSSMTSMGAMVNGETLNIEQGTTEVSLGQPPRLDFLEFASRVRRTPQDNTEYIS